MKYERISTLRLDGDRIKPRESGCSNGGLHVSGWWTKWNGCPVVVLVLFHKIVTGINIGYNVVLPIAHTWQQVDPHALQAFIINVSLTHINSLGIIATAGPVITELVIGAKTGVGKRCALVEDRAWPPTHPFGAPSPPGGGR